MEGRAQPWDENKIHKTHFSIPMMPWKMEIQTGYRIIEVGGHGEVLSLFHGTNGSRQIKLDVWNHAEEKMVMDGSHGKKYLSGWHFLKTEEEAVEFFESKFRVTSGRFIVKCYVRDNVRSKHPDGKGKACWLAQDIMIKVEDVLDGMFRPYIKE
jgi:hypothetical protein